MASLKSILSNPFSFLFTTRGAEEQVAVYLVREHKRGRSLSDIVAEQIETLDGAPGSATSA